MSVEEQAALSGRVRSFDGPAYLHLPLDARDPVDFTALHDEENRWNGRGEPTLYLACDPGVALAEFARHCPPDAGTTRRRLFRFDLHLERLVDLVAPPEFGSGRFEPGCWLDRNAARRTAAMARSDPSVLGLIVPSVAFLDDAARFNLALFVDRLDRATGPWFPSVAEVGRLEVERAS